MDLSGLSAATTAIQTLSNIILATPQSKGGYQPQNGTSNSVSLAQQPPILMFHYEGEQVAALSSDVTDHYIEDNSTIQDQVALKPVTIQTHGYIGELNDVVPDVLRPLKTAAEKLTIVSAYTPALSATAILAYNQAAFLYANGQNVVNAAVATWNSIKNGFTGSPDVQTKQQLMFVQLYGYWTSKTLFTVETPWAKFNNCVIMSLRAIQGEETDKITDFEVVFKQLRFAASVTATQVAIMQARAGDQNAQLDQSIQTPKGDISLSDALSQYGLNSGLA